MDALPPSPPERRSLSAALRAVVEALGHGPGADALTVHGAAGPLGPALATHLAASVTAAPLLYVVAEEERAEAIEADVAFFAGGAAPDDDPLAPPTVLTLPAIESSPYLDMQPDRRTIMRRLAVLFRLAQGRAPRVLVASAAALFRRVLPRAGFARLCANVDAKTSVDREALVAALVDAGYARAQVVEDPGTFAVRGSVVDLFPPVYKHPVRIELFGDEVESVRLFDGATQRTLRELPRVAIHPVRETVQSPGADPRARLLEAADAAAYPSSKTRQLLEQIEAKEDFFGVEALAPIFHPSLVSLFEYLPPETRIVVEDEAAILEEVRRGVSKLRESAAHRRAEHRLALDPAVYVLDDVEAAAALAGHRRLELRTLEVTRASGDGEPAPAIRVHAETNAGLRAELQERRGREGDGDLGAALRGRLRQLLGEGYRVRVVAPNRTHAERVAGLLAALGLDPKFDKRGHHRLADLLDGADGPSPLAVLTGPLTHGFRLPEDRLALISEEEIFGPRAHRESRPTTLPGLGDLGELADGDAVVHDEHGIGRYRGLRKLEVRGVAQDFLHLEYDGGSVYIPVYRIGLVRKYVGSGTEAVRLDKLGGKTWQEKKRRVSAEAKKVAEELLQLYAQRKALPGHAFPPPDVLYREFEETFPFDETPDQAKAIDAVLADLQGDTPMDRLICGDVGYGKTEVALRGTLLAVLGGKQVAVLAPTTVLAEQHFVTFSERFREFPVRVGSLSRFRSPTEQKRTIAAVGEGKIDVVVGTHRLLSRDVRWKSLGLVVIDEEQRFGVVHKERLKEMRSQVDVLTLTATPIPRTLQMAMTGMREISIIATPPADRLAIRTFVCHWDPELLREALGKELARGGQVFFVHNRVDDLPKWRDAIAALAPGARVAMAHGQMGDGELEKVMVDFVDGRYDVLCCTTIIEAGLDIPRANTMIVNNADRFGLAQLYQIRGRIGRSKERAFCYLVVQNEGALSPEAKQRLAVLQRFTELGAGFQVATHDLEIRGAGDLLGARQSGVLAAVGFDTYARLLEEAVAQLKGQPIKQEHDPEISVDVPAFLPDDYIPDTGQRLELYRRLAQARDEDEVREVLAELADRYGELPDEATLLGEVMVLKTVVRRIGALGFELGPLRLTLSVGADTRLDPAKVMKLVQSKGGRWKLTPDMRLVYTFDDAEKSDRLSAARRRLDDVTGCVA
jgi:transcription-repair coupling factor (superfamily II helicase)